MAEVTAHEVAHIMEMGEAQTLAAMARSLDPELAAASGVRAERIGAATAMVAAKIPAALLNRVVGLGVDKPATQAEVDAILALYGKAGVPFMVQLSPQARPVELPLWLEARGLARG